MKSGWGEVAEFGDGDSRAGHLGGVDDGAPWCDDAVAHNFLTQGVRHPEGTDPTFGSRPPECASGNLLSYGGAGRSAETGGERKQGIG
jgi:hypothetical protein